MSSPPTVSVEEGDYEAVITPEENYEALQFGTDTDDAVYTGLKPGTKHCKAGYWGDQCDKTCNRGCVDGTCNRDDGQCQCAPGWREPSCAVCDDSHYSQNCSRDCGRCTGGDPCHNITGRCPSCEPGYIPPLCQNSCPVKKYGQNCALSCGHCADNVTCHHVDGHCPDGCGSGYLGELCDTECATGRYGQNCSELCGNCHHKAICDHVTGHCPQGCPGNFSTTLCKVCVAGLWGENCTESCGQCAGDGSCDRMTAECSAGCVAGWNGTVCQQKVAVGDLPRVDVVVVVPTVSAAVAVVVVVAVVLHVWWSKRRQDRTMPMNDMELTEGTSEDRLSDRYEIVSGASSTGRVSNYYVDAMSSPPTVSVEEGDYEAVITPEENYEALQFGNDTDDAVCTGLKPGTKR
ncbi:hypothetical protein BaRGS_00026835 [Batillaria attramentaria]|uniref:EGF-like domain-containing protein n=1 Tax=Batillaria attramentaria TaxID=370345 RepID=A0ABD0K3F1_9CAEN